MNIEESIDILSKKTPYILRVLAIFILVLGVIGFLFYSAVLAYQIFDSDFLADWSYSNFSGTTIILILVLQEVVHFGLVLSAILLLKGKRQGLFIFIVSYGIIVALGYLLHDVFGWFGLGLGFLMATIMTLYYKRLK